MYSITILPNDAGKTLEEVLEKAIKTDDFERRLGTQYSETSCILTLDEKIVSYPDFKSTKVQTGQSLRIFQLACGG